jgi:hypothetical protein
MKLATFEERESSALFSACFSTRKMEAMRSSETGIHLHQLRGCAFQKIERLVVTVTRTSNPTLWLMIKCRSSTLKFLDLHLLTYLLTELSHS